MRLLERRTNTRFNGEASTNVKYRREGVPIKHCVEEKLRELDIAALAA